jgi:hypothetical protein
MSATAFVTSGCTHGRACGSQRQLGPLLPPTTQPRGFCCFLPGSQGPAPFATAQEALHEYAVVHRLPGEGWTVKRQTASEVTFHVNRPRGWDEVRTVNFNGYWYADFSRGCTSR